jgi:hypothetical protein
VRLRELQRFSLQITSDRSVAVEPSETPSLMRPVSETELRDALVVLSDLTCGAERHVEVLDDLLESDS